MIPTWVYAANSMRSKPEANAARTTAIANALNISKQTYMYPIRSPTNSAYRGLQPWAKNGAALLCHVDFFPAETVDFFPAETLPSTDRVASPEAVVLVSSSSVAGEGRARFQHPAMFTDAYVRLKELSPV